MEQKRKRGRPRNIHAAEVKKVLKYKMPGEKVVPNSKIPDKDYIPKGGKYDYLNEIAFSITDISFGTLHVRKTANAWWGDRSKVENLILSFKYGCTLEESFLMAGIGRKQYERFIEVHPDFAELRPVLMKNPTLQARQTLVGHLNDPQYALAYLERKEKKEFSKSSIEIKGDTAEELGVIILPAMRTKEGLQVQTKTLKGDSSV